MSLRPTWFTYANGLTLLRLLLAPALVLAIVDGAAVAATGIFWLAVATDVADGKVARHFGEASPLGGRVDHAVDAAFVAAGTSALAWVEALPFVLPALIAAAFAQYALDSGFLASRGVRPRRLGRWNGIAYYVVVAVPIMRDALGLSWPDALLVRAFGWLLVASTLASMIDRLRLVLSTE